MIPIKDLTAVLPSLGLAISQLVGEQLANDEGRQLLGSLFVGKHRRRMPDGRHTVDRTFDRDPAAATPSAITPQIRWAGLFLFLYLLPYTLISHYMRYQMPLLGMQAILLTAGTAALLRTLRHAGFPSTPHEGPGR